MSKLEKLKALIGKTFKEGDPTTFEGRIAALSGIQEMPPDVDFIEELKELMRNDRRGMGILQTVGAGATHRVQGRHR